MNLVKIIFKCSLLGIFGTDWFPVIEFLASNRIYTVKYYDFILHHSSVNNIEEKKLGYNNNLQIA